MSEFCATSLKLLWIDKLISFHLFKGEKFQNICLIISPFPTLSAFIYFNFHIIQRISCKFFLMSILNVCYNFTLHLRRFSKKYFYFRSTTRNILKRSQLLFKHKGMILAQIWLLKWFVIEYPPSPSLINELDLEL